MWVATTPHPFENSNLLSHEMKIWAYILKVKSTLHFILDNETILDRYVFIFEKKNALNF